MRTVHDDLQAAIDILEERVSEFPGPTCTDIDALLREVAPVQKEADRLSRLNDDNLDVESFSDFVRLVDGLTYRELPAALDALRGDNDSLRTALHEALESRKKALKYLGSVVAKLAENDEDEGCPVNDPDCMGGDGDCHDACERPRRQAERGAA